MTASHESRRAVVEGAFVLIDGVAINPAAIDSIEPTNVGDSCRAMMRCGETYEFEVSVRALLLRMGYVVPESGRVSRG